MNKYSKRALKTTATVGMSLAMVLSGVAAPTMKINAANEAPGCIVAQPGDLANMNVFINNTAAKWKEATAETTFTADFFTTYGTKFDAAGESTSAAVTSVGTTKYEPTITVGGKTLVLVWDVATDGGSVQNSQQTGDGTVTYYYAIAKDSTINVSVIEKVKVNTIDYINGTLTAKLASGTVLSDSDVATASTEGKLKIVTGSAAAFNTSLGKIKEGCSAADTTNAKDLLNLAAAVKATGATLINLANDGETNDADQYDAIEAFLTKYEVNLNESQKETLAIELERLGEGTMNPSTDGYQTALSNFLDRETTKLEKLLADSDYTSLSDAGKVITNSTVDKLLKDLKESTDYKRFRRESVVVDFVAEIEALKDDIKTIVAAVDRVKNDSYKEYAAGGTKSVLNAVSKIVYTTKDGIETKKLTISDYEILKAFKEDVVDVILTMDSKEIGNRWVDKTSQSAFVTDTQYTKVTRDFGALSSFNSETGEFAWDELVAHMDKVISSLKDLDSIAKLDSVTLQAGDRQLLVAADDAVYFLQNVATDYGKNENLTSAEARTVRDASRKVTELMETYRVKFGSIDTTVNGWVDKGNGNWTYYENGSAVTKWVAAGSNWYYVKGGNMVRNAWVAENASGARWYYVNDKGVMVTNTVVDGYKIDANGIWAK